ncbi:MAG TPA: CCA tRNA nucleotidyltransferase [Candidatus Kryptonia bacterium]|nr:CCA tRNA nucleotidyltransferase [Candidatus Kryptonia bacterium]
MTLKEHLARQIAARLREAGYTAYLAGGCVRDRLLGHEPSDFDIATDAPADAVQRLFPRTVPVGVQFGVVLVVVEGQSFEVATFRADSVYLDGRRPASVRFSSPEEDAARRDFTINGMFLDPISDRIIDHVGGQDDLRAGVIRAIGDPSARLYEDRLRMLRAVRFAARFGFTIEPLTFDAIRAAAPHLGDIAWERIGEEIVRILCEGNARRGFELLDATGLLPVVLPEIAALKGVEQSPDYHPEGDVFTHTLLLLAELDHPTETLALGALLHDVAKPLCAERAENRITFYGHCERGAEMAVAICQRLRRSREVWERVEWLVLHHLRVIHAQSMRVSTLKRFLAQDGIDELLALARLDALASNQDLRNYEFCCAKQAEFGAAQLKPPPLVRGRDLLDMGFAPGPRFREILDAVEEAQLEGRLTTRPDALAWVREQFRI